MQRQRPGDVLETPPETERDPESVGHDAGHAGELLAEQRQRLVLAGARGGGGAERQR